MSITDPSESDSSMAARHAAAALPSSAPPQKLAVIDRPKAGRADDHGGTEPSVAKDEGKTSGGVFYAKDGFAYLPGPGGRVQLGPDGKAKPFGLLNSRKVVDYVREHGLKAKIYLPGRPLPVLPRPIPVAPLQGAGGSPTQAPDYVHHPELSPHNIRVDVDLCEQQIAALREEVRKFFDNPLRNLLDPFAPAPPKLTELDEAQRLLGESRKALADGDAQQARRLADAADHTFRAGQTSFGRYRDGHYDRLEATQHGLEYVREGAKYTVGGLAIIATAGAAAGAVAGAEVGAVAAAEGGSIAGISFSPTLAGIPLGASTAGMLSKIAIDIVDPVARAIAGEKVDWGPLAAETVATIVSNRFRSYAGKMGGRLLASLTKHPATKNIARKVLEKAVGNVVISLGLGAGSRILKSPIYALQRELAGKPVTVDEFCNQLVGKLTEPKSLVTDIVHGILFGGTQLAVDAKIAAAVREAAEKAG